MAAKKLKKALKILDSALELNPESHSIHKYLRKSKDMIRAKLAEKLRLEHIEEEKRKLKEEEKLKLVKVEEKKTWLSKLHRDIERKRKTWMKIVNGKSMQQA